MRTFFERGREMNEQLLIQKIIEGNDHAFRILVEKYNSELFRVIYAILRNQKDAEDAVQEVFIKVYHSLPNYKDQGFQSWIKRIAVNHAIDMKRKQKRRQEEVMESPELSTEIGSREGIEWEVIRREKVKLVQKRLNELPKNYRDVIYDFYILEKSYKQIAEERKEQVKTIETKIYRARQWMKKHWKEDDFS